MEWTMISLTVRQPVPGLVRTLRTGQRASAALRRAGGAAGVAAALACVAFAPIAIPDLFAGLRPGLPSGVATGHSLFIAVGFALAVLTAVALGDRLTGGRRRLARLAALLLATQVVVTGIAWPLSADDRLISLVTSNGLAAGGTGLLALAHRGRLAAGFAITTAGLAASVLVPPETQVDLVGRLIALAIGSGFAAAGLALREPAD
jgi:hypothetical protein